MKKLWDLKEGFCNLELEGQGRGIIMGVTRLLLLGPFYLVKQPQEKWACDFRDDAPPLSYQLQVAEVIF